MSIGENIKKIRVQKGLTQKQLGELCGMADSAIRRYENGRANPKLETVEKIANVLDVNASILLGFNIDEYGPIKSEEEYEEAIKLLQFLKELQSEAQMDLEFIQNYRILNMTGKAKVNSYIKDLIKLPEYLDSQKMEIVADKDLQRDNKDIDESAGNDLIAIKNYANFLSDKSQENWDELGESIKRIAKENNVSKD